MKQKQSTTRANKLLRGVALLQLFLALIMFGLGPLLDDRSNWSIASVMIGSALVMIYCARERINDERVDQLKLRATKMGLLSGTLFTALVYFLTILFGVTMPLSAFDVLIVIMVITLACYYLWRWQDSRPKEWPQHP